MKARNCPGSTPGSARPSTGCGQSPVAGRSVQQQRWPLLPPVSGAGGLSSPSARVEDQSEIWRRAGNVKTTPGRVVEDYGIQSRELATQEEPDGSRTDK